MFAAGTLISTPKGPTPIEKLRVGDFVLSPDGTWLAVTESGRLIYQNLVQLKYMKMPVVVCSADTKFIKTVEKGKRIFKLREIGGRQQKVAFANPTTDYGVDCDYAYMIGAMAGNGTCIKHSRQLYITSQDGHVPAAVARELGVGWKKATGQYQYTIQTGKAQNYPYYNEWLRGKKLFEKVIDLEVVATWNRKSQLKLLAGLLDTDGSVHMDAGKVRITFDNTSKNLVEAFNWLMLHLFQTSFAASIDFRPPRATLPCYKLKTKRQADIKRILRELDPYLHQPSKKWKPEYDQLPEPRAGGRLAIDSHVLGVTAFYIRTTGPYLLANGIVITDSAPKRHVKQKTAACSGQKNSDRETKGRSA